MNTSTCARETDTHSIFRSFHGVPRLKRAPSLAVACRARASRTLNCTCDSFQYVVEEACRGDLSELERYSALGGRFVGCAMYLRQARAVC
jgi:hypothetical protein